MTGPLPLFVLRRIATVVLVVVVATSLTYAFFRLARPELYAYDGRSVLGALVSYLERAFLHFDFGVSWQAGQDNVAELVRTRFGADVSLVVGGVVIGVVAGMAGGAVCAARPRSLAARGLFAAATLALCTPVYWLGLVSVFMFGPDYGLIELPIFVSLGTYTPLTQDPLAWAHALLVPWLLVALPLAAVCLRMTRSAMVEVLEQDYIRTAVAKGLSGQQVLRGHAIKPSAAPVISLTGANIPILVANALLVEQIFNIPGIFRLTTGAIGDEDYPILMAIVVLAALLVVLGNMLADIVFAWLDPRVRD